MFNKRNAVLIWSLCQASAFVTSDGGVRDRDSSESLIPDKILFNYKDNLLVPSAGSIYPAWGHKKALSSREKEQRQDTKQNLHKIIKLHPGMQVIFYDNNECARAIQRVHSKELREYFTNEDTGMFKSDICRLAMLWEHGGYYFDNDIEMLTDVRRSLPAGISMSSVLALPRCNRPNAVFQAFLAAAPQHPVIMDAMDGTLEWYKNEVYKDTKGVPAGFHRLMGTEVLGASVMKWLAVDHLKAGRLHQQVNQQSLQQKNSSGGNESVYFFEEDEGHVENFGLQHREGRGSSCQVFVKDFTEAIAWSRFVGSGEWCDKP